MTQASLKKVFTLLLLILSLSLPLQILADFSQGSIDMVMQTPQGNVDVKLKISPKAVRSNILMGLGQFKMDMTFLIQLKENAELFQLNDAAKTYSPVKLSDQPTNIQNEKISTKSNIHYANVKVKKIGSETILGYKATHLSIISDEFTSEIWISEEIGLFSTIKKLQEINKNSSAQLEIFKALESENYKGFPLKMWWQEKGGDRMDMKVTRIQNEKLPDALFEIPKDYTKTSSAGLASPQGMNNIKSILENMTPEQKEAIKKMMQGQQGQQAPAK